MPQVNEIWTVIAVLGRPSISTRDFFNSIKFHQADVEAASTAEALDKGDPWSTGADLTGGYEVLSVHAFPRDGKAGE